MEIIFIVLFIFLLYVYIGYPLLLIVLSERKKINKVEGFTPVVTILISAYNEEKHISEKLKNTLALEYPKDNLEIIVVSDASTDKTDEIVREYEKKGVILYRSEKWLGKIAAYKLAMEKLKGEIVVFSDATSNYRKDTIKKIVRNFADVKVGAVTGRLEYKKLKKTAIGSGEKKYWQYEIIIRESESKLRGLVAVTGAIYAIRKNLFPDFPNYLADDLIIPLSIQREGYKAIYENEAVCEEFTTAAIEEEMQKRIRITVQNVQGILFMKDLLNPFKYGLFSIQLWSHKVLRMCLPFLIVGFLMTNLFLIKKGGVYLTFLGLQLMFYSIAILGFILHKIRKDIKIFSIPFYFCLSNIAVFIGVMKTLSGFKITSWETSR